MSTGFADDAKELVRQSTDIVDLVGSYVQLRRQGRNFVGICPWHDDSRPSLQVNPDRQSFKCWVCDVGGDVFSFVMRVEGLEFREALELLAERAGVELKRARSPAGNDAAAAGPGDKRLLYRVLAWAEEQFHRCLLGDMEAEAARQYLAERKISPDTVRRFRIGFAPNRWDWLLERARRSELSPAVLERAGLLRKKDGGGYYDWFRGRVMFSIRDARARSIAFGGRVLPQLADDRAAKYINSPETPLFSKSRELYALDAARDHFKDGGAVVMEGYTDVVIAHQNGLRNCVAVLGTALGERHLQVLRRYTERVTLVLDGDEAGRRRTNEILDALLALFEKNQVDLRILTLPEGVDPCDFIVQHGSETFQRLLANSLDALDHKFKAVTNGLDTLADTHRASQAAEQLLVSLAQIRGATGTASSQSMLREEQMLSRIARHFHLPEEKLRSRLSALRRTMRPKASSPTSTDSRPLGDDPANQETIPALADLPSWDRELLELVILEPPVIERLASIVQPSDFGSDVARRIFATCFRLVQDGWQNDFGRLLAEYDDPQIKNLLVELDEACATKADADRQRWLNDLLETHERRTAERAARTRLAAARDDAEEAEQLLAEFCEQAKSKHRSRYERRNK